MADILHESDSARDAAHDIENAATAQEATVHAFNGIANLLLSILWELRDARESRR